MSTPLIIVIVLIALSLWLIRTRATTLIEKWFLVLFDVLLVYGYMTWPWVKMGF